MLSVPAEVNCSPFLFLAEGPSRSLKRLAPALYSFPPVAKTTSLFRPLPVQIDVWSLSLISVDLKPRWGCSDLAGTSPSPGISSFLQTR